MLFDFEKFKRKYKGDITIPLAMAYKISTMVHPSMKYRLSVTAMLCCVKETEAYNYIYIDDEDDLFREEMDEINFIINFYEVPNYLSFRQFEYYIKNNTLLKSLYEQYNEYDIAESYFFHLKYIKNIDISDVSHVGIKNISEYFEKLSRIRSLEELSYNNISQLIDYYKNININISTILDYNDDGDLFTTIINTNTDTELGFAINHFARTMDLEFEFYEAKCETIWYDGNDQVGEYIMELNCSPNTVAVVSSDNEFIPSLLCRDLYFETIDPDFETKIESFKLYAADIKGKDTNSIIVY